MVNIATCNSLWDEFVNLIHGTFTINWNVIDCILKLISIKSKKIFFSLSTSINQFYDLNWRPHLNLKMVLKIFYFINVQFLLFDHTGNKTKFRRPLRSEERNWKQATLDRRLKLLLPHHLTLPEVIQPVSVSPYSEFQFTLHYTIISLWLCGNIFICKANSLRRQSRMCL
jgi:hypothetical protein